MQKNKKLNPVNQQSAGKRCYLLIADGKIKVKIR